MLVSGQTRRRIVLGCNQYAFLPGWCDIISVPVKRLNPDKLHIRFINEVKAEMLSLPRHYTLTHSDITGELFLSIGNQYDLKKISGIYTRLMRDEVLAELVNENNYYVLNLYCHISGGLVLGSAKWRYNIFQAELPLVIEVIRYGDREIFENNPYLDAASVHVHFKSTRKAFNKVENWGNLSDYA